MGSLIANPCAALGTSAPARWQCCRGGVRMLVARRRSSQERRVGDSGGQPPVPVPAASSLSVRLRRGSGRYASTHGHMRGIVFSPAHSGFHLHGPAPACAHLGRLCVEPGRSAGHAEWKQEPPQAPWPCRRWDGRATLAAWFANFHYGVRFSPTPGGEGIWITRPCWAIRLMAFLLKSDNLGILLFRF